VVDLHCHLLPAVDDGPRTLDESVAYAAAAAAAGTRTIVATPHVEQVDVRSLPDRVREVRAALAEAGVPIDVVCGGELKPESIPELSDDDLDVIAHGPDGARWLLYEVPFRGVGDAFLDGAHELWARGFGLLLAHPERSRDVLDDGIDAIDALRRRGARVAANVGPLLGAEGATREANAHELLARGVPDLIATDAHPPSRPYTLAQGGEIAAAIAGRPGVAHRLTAEAPARLLAEGIRAPRRSATGRIA
jgi:protein-tyrosine phosphatase